MDTNVKETEKKKELLRQPFLKENTEAARLGRVEYIKNLGKKIDDISETMLDAKNVNGNIESYVGTVKIPTGLVGPILYEYEKGKYDQVYTLATTTEGALVASLNRGVSVVNACGGFRAYTQDKLMVRAPMYCFESIFEAEKFKDWILSQREFLNKFIKQYSQRAELVEIKANLFGKNVDTKFYYRCQDASGQNLTTICTWHSCLWIEEEFNRTHDFKIKTFVLEGNGASDKKLSYSSMINGRGTNVTAEVVIDREVLIKRLKVTPEELMHFFNISQQVVTHDGMFGNNVNVANAIAAIFASTGQDLACIHESAVGILHIEPHERGLYFSLKLPKLVVGTVGGGVGLPSQREALELMDCYGSGKVERFAELIAGFCLSLEISTLSAMVSGQFALAHERLGRNKPTSFIKLEELISGYLQEKMPSYNINYVSPFEEWNGIMTKLSAKQTSKHLGLSLWQISGEEKKLAVLKSKPTDGELLNCMYILTGMIDPKLSKSFCKYQGKSEFVNNHVRELVVYNHLQKFNFDSMPYYYGGISDFDREGHMVLLEYLEETSFKLINSECSPEKWGENNFKTCVERVIEASLFLESIKSDPVFFHAKFEDYGSFFSHALEILNLEYGKRHKPFLAVIEKALNYLKENEEKVLSEIPSIVVHNDFSPRNIGVKKNDEVKIYDWELATIDIPHRDFIELYSFTKNSSLNFSSLKNDFEKKFLTTFKMNEIGSWEEGYKYAFAKFLVTRVSLYLLGDKLQNYTFMPSLINNLMLINDEEKFFV